MTDAEALELLNGEFDLDIPNFKKWNPDTRHKRAWFALSVDWFHDPKVIRLSAAERAVWVSLLSVYAVQPSRFSRVTCALLARSLYVDLALVKRSILKLLNLQLVNLRCHVLQTYITNKQTDEEGNRGTSSSSVQRVIEELRGIEDECLSTVPQAAQLSWLKEFGIEVISQILPTAFASWRMDQPRSSKTNQVVPLAMYLRRCFEVQKKNPTGGGMQSLRETDWNYVFGRST